MKLRTLALFALLNGCSSSTTPAGSVEDAIVDSGAPDASGDSSSDASLDSTADSPSDGYTDTLADALPETEPDAGGITLPPVPADFLFMIDRSASWSTKLDRFGGMRGGVKYFMTMHPDHFAAGVFPHVGEPTCDSSSFALDAPFSTSTGKVFSILDALTFSGQSPFAPALAGLGKVAHTHVELVPEHTTSVVILTDAMPGDDETCGTFTDASDYAAKMFDNGKKGNVHVHVLSVMGTAIPENHEHVLGDIAVKGGGYSSFVGGNSTEVLAGTREALDGFHDRMLTCNRTVPAGAHPETLTVTYKDGTTAMANRVADASECVGATFYLDDPTNPTKATLCPGIKTAGGFCELTYQRALTKGAPRISTGD